MRKALIGLGVHFAISLVFIIFGWWMVLSFWGFFTIVILAVLHIAMAGDYYYHYLAYFAIYYFFFGATLISISIVNHTKEDGKKEIIIECNDGHILMCSSHHEPRCICIVGELPSKKAEK